MGGFTPADRRALLLLSLLALATSLPFINRAYFIDDFYFVTMAKGIVDNPLRPYDFKSDDAGLGNVAWERGQLPRMVNPPLLHYYLAGVIKVFGDETWKLRASYLLFSFVSLFTVYFLGKRFVARPFYAAALMAVTPAYWLTSYSLLIDGALLSFILLTLLTWIRALERKSTSLVLWSGLLMGLTMLTKYTGILVVWLVLVWQLMAPERRQWKTGYLAYGVFILTQLFWAAWNVNTYGQPHFVAALGRGMTSFAPMLLAQKAIVVASFLGGTTIFMVFSFALLGKISKRWMLGLVILAIFLGSTLASAKGGFTLSQAILLSLFLSSTLAFFIACKLAAPSWRMDKQFLFIWLISAGVELVTVMPWTAGRYLLCLLPPTCWLYADFLDQWGGARLRSGSLAATAVLALLIAQGDYLQANAVKHLAVQMSQKNEELQKRSPKPKRRWYYLSDTFDGSQPYLAPLGWQNALPDQTFSRGDLFMRAYYRRSSWWNVSESLKSMEPVVFMEMPSRNPFRTMDVPGSAGFYGSCWGALPWVISSHPLERYELYQVKGK